MLYSPWFVQTPKGDKIPVSIIAGFVGKVQAFSRIFPALKKWAGHYIMGPAQASGPGSGRRDTPCNPLRNCRCRCSGGIRKTPECSPGAAIPPPTMCGSARSCSSRHGWRRCWTTTAGFWPNCPRWRIWPEWRRTGSSSCGRGWATTTGPATCKRPPGRSWRSTAASFRTPMKPFGPSAAWGITPPGPSPPLPSASPSRRWMATCCGW